MNELATRRAPIVAHDVATRTVTARLVTWDDPRDVVDPDGARYRETFTRGGLVPRDRVYVLDEHGGSLIGRAFNHRDDGTGHVADLEIADTSAGRDLLALVDAGILDAVSIEFDQRAGDNSWTADRTAVTRSNAPLHGVAFAFQPAHTAPVLAVREEPTVSVTMPDVPMPVTLTARELSDDDFLALRGEVLSIREEMATRTEALAHPLAGYRSLSDYANAVADLPGDTRTTPAKRALADQISSNNPGVAPPAWVMDVKGVISKGRPAINALGAQQLPPGGLELDWPYFDGNLGALVGVQATQKTAITSVRVDIKKGTTTIKVFAGGSDIAWPLIRRSQPSYLDAYMRILSNAYAFVTDNDFVDTLYASGTGTIGSVLVPGTATASQVRAAIFKASVLVFEATGSPASVVLASSDWITALGALDGLWPAAYGTTNASGTASADTLAVNVSGLPVVYEPNLTAGSLIVTNNQAAQWYEDGPFTLTMDDVNLLGHNVAVWGLGVAAVYVPTGVVVIKAA